MTQPMVISFYTLGTPYEVEVKRLIDSCKKFGIEADIVGLPNEGSWEKNCALKPRFILEKLKQWDRPVLWVDADAAFLQRPNFQDFATCDFSVRVNEFLPTTHESRILSGTLFARNNAQAQAVLEKWAKMTEDRLHDPKREMEFWDQTALRDALLQQEALDFLALPLKFCKIFDFDDLFISEPEIVIEHYQASRRHKHADHRCCH